MKKLFFFLVLLASGIGFVSCEKKDNLADNPKTCGCSSLMDCTAGCTCGCQD